MIAPTMPVEPSLSKRKVWLVSIAFLLVAVLAVSLGLGFGLPRDDSKNSLRQNSNASKFSTPMNGNVNDTLLNPVSNPAPIPELITAPTHVPNPAPTPASTPVSSPPPTPEPTTSPAPVSSSALNPIDDENPITVSSRLSAISDVTIKQEYDSCDSLTDDLFILAQHIANRTIENYYFYFDESWTYNDDGITTQGTIDRKSVV